VTHLLEAITPPQVLSPFLYVHDLFFHYIAATGQFEIFFLHSFSPRICRLLVIFDRSLFLFLRFDSVFLHKTILTSLST